MIAELEIARHHQRLLLFYCRRSDPSRGDRWQIERFPHRLDGISGLEERLDIAPSGIERRQGDNGCAQGGKGATRQQDTRQTDRQPNRIGDALQQRIDQPGQPHQKPAAIE